MKTNRSGAHRWRGRLPIPKRAHPLVRALYIAANQRGMTMTEIAERAGVRRRTIAEWTQRRSPGIAPLEACFNVLGLELAPVLARPKEEKSNG